MQRARKVSYNMLFVQNFFMVDTRLACHLEIYISLKVELRVKVSQCGFGKPSQNSCKGLF